MRAKTVFILGSMGIFLCALAVWQGTTGALATASGERELLRAQADHLRRTLPDTAASVARTQRTLDDAERDLAALTPAGAPARPPAVFVNNQNELTLADPALKSMHAKAVRGTTRRRYERFYRQAGLSPAQIAQFEKISLDHSERSMAVQVRHNREGASERGDWDQLSRELETAQMALLGPEAYRRLEEYQRLERVRTAVVLAFAGTAALSGVPLSAEQGAQLEAAALASADGGDAAASGDALLKAVDFESFHARAREILTPAQFNVLRYVQMPTGSLSLAQLNFEKVVAQAVVADAATGLGAGAP